MSAYRAARLPSCLGPAGWNAIAPNRRAFPELDADVTADVTIIGAGFAGLAAARRLSLLASDASVIVVDAHAIGEAGTGRNSGFMIDLPHELNSEDYAGSGDDRAVIALNRRAQRFAADAVEDYAIPADFFDPAGKVNGAASEAAHAHNVAYARHLDSLGEPSEMLDAADMADLTGSTHYRSGLFTPGTVMLQPAGYVHGLAAGLARGGVRIFERSPVTGFQRNGASWTVATKRGTISTGRVIVTVNGHLESFGVARGRLMHLFLFAVMSREMDADTMKTLGGRSRWAITPSDPMGTTLRRIDAGQGGNRIVTRTCAVLRSGMAATRDDLARASRVMRAKFDKRFPQLAGFPMEYGWAGHLCLSLNGVAVMGEIDEGVFSGCVQNGLGTARGTLTGIGAAELACGVESEITRHFTAQAAPRKLPPQPLRDWGANGVLRLKEWRAAAE